jgi:hypothetical protein
MGQRKNGRCFTNNEAGSTWILVHEFRSKLHFTFGSPLFRFPIHIQQVFYAADEGPWKVVCKADVRGNRRGRAFAEEHEDAEAQFSGYVSPHADNTEMGIGEPSHSDFAAYGSFVEEQDWKTS